MKVELEIEDQKIADVLDAADIQYWGRYFKGEDYTRHLLVVQGNGSIRIQEDETHENNQPTRNFELNAENIRAALAIIGEKWPWHLKDILTDGGGDATTGDVLIQVAIFKDIVYG